MLEKEENGNIMSLNVTFGRPKLIKQMGYNCECLRFYKPCCDGV